ncbi:MAG: hypothetical protein MUO21_04305, partial [Nitrososphaeraceae archaeon]|nr:hypothetical protein [Nitrososphaeraceae archaeon]
SLHQGRSLNVAGTTDPGLQMLINAINEMAGSYGHTIHPETPDYVHQGDISTTSTNILLNGINLTQGEFILLYDSTPFGSKGHIAVNLPCNPDNPHDPIFDILVGRAPDLFVLPLGYLEQLSKPGKMCVYHGQFGFGDPITDLILKYVGDDPIKLEGPHSIVISTHESYKPTTESFFEQGHNATN